MECQISSMAASNVPEEGNIPEGKVGQVCREWLIREDGVLAYKLQKEEIQHHYGHNREKNQLVRSDIQEARTIQRSEDNEAEMIRKAYEQMLLEQEETDALIAQQLQEKIAREDLEKQRHMEEEDQRIALELQKKEKLRLQRKREERELRQVEKARAEQSCVTNGASDSKSTQEIVLSDETENNPLHKDFTDFCLEPPPNLTPEELHKFREEQDAELARLLQEQEMKRRSQNCHDRQIAIEAQDRELARVLQEQERARAKKAREKARQKALLQQQESMQTIEEAQIHYSISPDHGDDQASHSETRLRNNEWFLEEGSSSASGFPAHQVKNVAMVIDPTYNHRKSALEAQSNSQITSLNSPGPSPERSSADTSPYNTGGIDGFYESGDDDGEIAAPPYMPIQGQRRAPSLEKGKKCKKNKDGCKTQ